MPKLTENQIKWGSRYLAAHNVGTMGVKKVVDQKTLENYWNEAYQNHADAGIDLGEEIEDWAKRLRKGDKYSVGAVLKELPWLK